MYQNNVIVITPGGNHKNASLNKMADRMEDCEWLRRNRAARENEDPDLWDHDEIALLEEEML